MYWLLAQVFLEWWKFRHFFWWGCFGQCVLLTEIRSLLTTHQSVLASEEKGNVLPGLYCKGSPHCECRLSLKWNSEKRASDFKELQRSAFSLFRSISLQAVGRILKYEAAYSSIEAINTFFLLRLAQSRTNPHVLDTGLTAQDIQSAETLSPVDWDKMDSNAAEKDDLFGFWRTPPPPNCLQ